MLGEFHDILHEFPEYRSKIRELMASNREFAGMLREHDIIDAKIRDLELHDQPVADEYMEDLKKQRALMKDRLYAVIRAV